MSDLFPPDEVARIEAESPPLQVANREKVHTAKLLSRADRDAVLRKFVAGKSRRQIAHELGISRNTVAAVIWDAEASGATENFRVRMARRLEGILEDHLVELETHPKELSSVDFGILTDKWEKFAGQAQVRVEVSIRKEDPGEVFKALTDLAAGIIDVQATPVPNPTENTP
jgi:transposase